MVCDRRTGTESLDTTEKAQEWLFEFDHAVLSRGGRRRRAPTSATLFIQAVLELSLFVSCFQIRVLLKTCVQQQQRGAYKPFIAPWR